MEGFVNGIKKIAKKHTHLKGFFSIPISGNTRDITEDLVKSFKRLGVETKLFDLEEKFHHYMQIVNPVFYDNNKQEFSCAVQRNFSAQTAEQKRERWHQNWCDAVLMRADNSRS